MAKERAGVKNVKCEVCGRMMIVSAAIERENKPYLCSRKDCKARRE